MTISRAHAWVATAAVLGGCLSACPGEGGVDGGTAGDAGELADGGPAADAGSEPESCVGVECVDAARYTEDLAFVAQPRIPGSAHWQAVQDLCAETFAALGYDVEVHAYETGVNIIGTLLGRTAPDEVVLVGAHYDSVSECAGADDNATGTAGVLEAARALAGGAWARTLKVACWDEEEDGLIGSSAWVARAVSEGEDVVAYLNYEMIGYRSDEEGSQEIPGGFSFIFPDEVAAIEADGNRGNFIAVVHDLSSRPMAQAFSGQAQADGLETLTLEVSDALKTSDLFADLRRSDHAPFWDANLPAAMITDTANFRNGRYHCTEGPDEAGTVDVEFAVNVVRATTAAAEVALRAE